MVMTQPTDHERAEFEAWGSGHNFDFTHAGFGLYAKTETQAAWMAWKEHAARRAQVVPKGWRLLPEKHTLDMSIAFAESFYSKARCIDDDDISDWYSELLAAAPQPPEANSAEFGGIKTAPVQMPEPYDYVEWRERGFSQTHKTALYTEHQVRKLLAEKESK